MKVKRALRRIGLSVGLAFQGLTCLLLFFDHLRSISKVSFHLPSQAQGSASEPISGSIEYQGDHRILNLWGDHEQMVSLSRLYWAMCSRLV